VTCWFPLALKREQALLIGVMAIELSVFVQLRSTWLCRFQFCYEGALPDRE
jgi:hypothetical protein